MNSSRTKNTNFKFDISKLDKLNHPERIIDINPSYIWDKIEISKPETIADIGAGTGLFSKEFSKLAPESKIFALDISQTMISWIEANICPTFPNVETRQMAESKIPLDKGTIDIALMINLHHELHDSLSVIKECYRILKPGGKIAICDWKKIETPKGPPLGIRYTPEEVELQLIEGGFSDIKIYNGLKNNWLVIGLK